MSTITSNAPARRADRVPVTVDQYRRFRRDGMVVVPQLVSPDEVADLRQHTDDLMQGRLPEQQDKPVHDGADGVHADIDLDHRKDAVQTVRHLVRPPEHLSPEEKAQHFLRIHMLHRKLALHERYMLHPGVLDVLEILIGPDVLAMQTMLFLKPPGKPGQGWHQDSYYIPTSPDTLCGAWIAIDDCDERNGAMWFAKGSGHEPVYPPCPEIEYGFGDRGVNDITYVKGVSDTTDENNMLTKVADRYDQVLISAKAGDVVFFNGHVLHRSKTNWTADRYRRAFVSHYCNARSFTQWGADADPNENPHADTAVDPATRMSNGSHILARGDTHLPFARPRFGTACAALLDPKERKRQSEYIAAVIANNDNGLLGCGIRDPQALLKEEENHDAGGY